MRLLLLMTVVIFSQQANAGCEASIVEGSHTALTEQEAMSGAWEDVRDVCYPGEAERQSVPATLSRARVKRPNHLLNAFKKLPVHYAETI